MLVILWQAFGESLQPVEETLPVAILICMPERINQSAVRLETLVKWCCFVKFLEFEKFRMPKHEVRTRRLMSDQKKIALIVVH